MRCQNLLFVGACLNNLSYRFLFDNARNVIIISQIVLRTSVVVVYVEQNY